MQLSARAQRVQDMPARDDPRDPTIFDYRGNIQFAQLLNPAPLRSATT